MFEYLSYVYTPKGPIRFSGIFSKFSHPKASIPQGWINASFTAAPQGVMGYGDMFFGFFFVKVAAEKTQILA